MSRFIPIELDGCHGSDSKFNLFNSSRIDAINITEVRDKAEGE